MLMCSVLGLFLFFFLQEKRKKMRVTFYDDITTDICVMAVSRLQGGGGHGDILSDIL